MNGVFHFTGYPSGNSTAAPAFDPELNDFSIELLNSYELMANDPKAFYDSFTNAGFPGYDPGKELFDSITNAGFPSYEKNKEDTFAKDLEAANAGFPDYCNNKNNKAKAKKDDYTAEIEEANEAADLELDFPGYIELPEQGWKEFDEVFGKSTGVKRAASPKGSKVVKKGGVTKSAMKKKGSAAGQKKKKVSFCEQLAKVVPEIRHGVEFHLEDCPYYA